MNSAKGSNGGPEEVYSLFKKSYPEYKADIKHFVSWCTRLDASKTKLHRMLWDDFIVRQVTEYIPYANEQIANGDGVDPYEAYYEEKVEEPKYSKRILTADTLRSVANPAVKKEVE